jgi:hypothetical protein
VCTTTTTVYIYLLVKLDCPFLITWRLDLSVCCHTISFFLFRKIGLGWWCSSIISMALSVSEQAGLQLRRWLAKLCQKKKTEERIIKVGMPRKKHARIYPPVCWRAGPSGDAGPACKKTTKLKAGPGSKAEAEERSHTACCEPSSTSPSMHAVHGFQRRSRNSSLSFSTIQHALTEQNKRRDE